MNGIVRDNLRLLARDELKNIFLSCNMLKKIDISFRSLNFSCLEFSHEVKNENSKNFY